MATPTPKHANGLSAWRILLLDLIYPAVLGSMVILIFVRIAIHGSGTFADPTTFLGVLIAIYYCAGFINSKLLSESSYTHLAAFLDLLNSAAIFISFYSLGFVSERMPVSFEGSLRQVILYVTLIFMFVAPILTRAFVWKNFRPGAARNFLSAAAIAVSSSGLLSSLNLLPLRVTATTVTVSLYVILLIYLLRLMKYGFSDTQPRQSEGQVSTTEPD